jgi:predicted GIY-YIG superfamily endonuclease
MIYNVYTLTCPIDNTVKYIGITTSDLKTRLLSHLCSNEGSYNKLIWIESCKINNLRPKIEVLDTIITNNKSNAYALEFYWIQQFKQWGFPLLNGMHYTINKRRGISPEEYYVVMEEERSNFLKIINNLKPLSL